MRTKQNNKSQSVRRALEIYSENQLKIKKEKRKNQKPEKEVESDCLDWLERNCFFASIVDSSATYNVYAKRFISGKASVGFPDCIAIHESGIFCAIELKAPSRRSTLRDGQRDFIEKVIEKNGFACVVDSSILLDEIWNKFLKSKNKKELLLSYLPKKKSDPKGESLFPE